MDINSENNHCIADKVLKQLLSAVALVEAAFPAGDYGLNEKQNMALNVLDCAAYELKKVDDSFRSECEKRQREYSKWQLSKLYEKGIIDKTAFERAIMVRGLENV